MENIKITIPIDPVPASRPRVTRYGTYYGKKYTQFKKDIQQYFTEHPLRGSKLPLSGVFYVNTTYHIKIPKTSLKTANNMEGTYCDKNIDLDNLNKSCYDIILNERYIEDDRYIVRESSQKLWSSRPRIEITIMKLYDLPKV